MLRMLRKRLTYTNIMLTLALVFAMTGGAYAASKVLITSTKQISPKVLVSLKGTRGKNGVPGSAGAPGAQGPQGPAGAAGAKGTNGIDGKEGPQGKEGPAGEEGPQGPEGPAGPTCPNGKCLLPEGATETGVWSFTAITVAETYVAISFPLRLISEPEFHYVSKAELGSGGAIAEGCPSIAFQKPEADPGKLCVYEGLTLHNALPPETVGGVDTTSGLDLTFALEDKASEAWGAGSWAVAR